jgi:Kinase binding protein CGI-121
VCRNMSSEIVYNLSASRNIGKGLSEFGIGDETSSVLFVILSPSKSCLDEVRLVTDGQEESEVLLGLQKVTDLTAVRSIYDIAPAEEMTSDLIDSIVTRIAARDIR